MKMIEYVPTHSRMGSHKPCLRAMTTRDCPQQHRWIPVELAEKEIAKMEAKNAQLSAVR